jgi:hypothetical protein
MAFLNLGLHKHPSGLAFDPEKVIQRVRAAFPEATILPGDQLAEETRRAEEALAQQLKDNPDGPARRVVESLRRKAEAYGPAYAFRMPVLGGAEVKGLARSVNVQFLFDEPLPEEVRRRLTEFLRSLGVGRLENSGDDKESRVLCDLPGPGRPEEGSVARFPP